MANVFWYTCLQVYIPHSTATSILGMSSKTYTGMHLQWNLNMDGTKRFDLQSSTHALHYNQSFTCTVYRTLMYNAFYNSWGGKSENYYHNGEANQSNGLTCANITWCFSRDSSFGILTFGSILDRRLLLAGELALSPDGPGLPSPFSFLLLWTKQRIQLSHANINRK